MKESKPHIIHIGFHPSFSNILDFDSYKISLIVHPNLDRKIGKQLRNNLAGIGTIDVPHNMNLNEYDNAFDQIEQKVEELVKIYGEPHAFVGIFEHATYPAAKLREKYKLLGTSAKVAYSCRDKVVMKKTLSQAGIKVPRNYTVTSNTKIKETNAFLRNISGKIVLKPRSQAAAQGVMVFQNKAELLDFYRKEGFQDMYQIEEFIEGDIYHFDGVVRDDEILFFSAAKYLYSCFDYETKCADLGAVTVDDYTFLMNAQKYTDKILKALHLKNSVFHLEVFLTASNEFIFLEIGNRFGGAGVSGMIKQLYNVDIVREAVHIDMGLSSLIKKKTNTSKNVGAWLYTAYKSKDLSEIISIEGLDSLPKSIIYSEIPEIGTRVNDEISVFPSSGKFFLKGDSSMSVFNDCKIIMDNYKVTLQPI